MATVDAIHDALRHGAGVANNYPEASGKQRRDADSARTAMTKRAREIARETGCSFAVAQYRARAEHVDASLERSRVEQRRRTHEAMVESNRAEHEREHQKWADRSDVPVLPGGMIPPGTSIEDPAVKGRRRAGRDRVSERLMAQYHYVKESA